MKAKELAERLMEYPDFDVEFKWVNFKEWQCLAFGDIAISDVREQDKVIVLKGDKID